MTSHQKRTHTDYSTHNIEFTLHGPSDVQCRLCFEQFRFCYCYWPQFFVLAILPKQVHVVYLHIFNCKHEVVSIAGQLKDGWWFRRWRLGGGERVMVWMTKIGGMQHVKGNTSGVVIWLLEKKNWLKNCNSLWERCKSKHFSLSGHWTPGRIGATISCRWWLWFAGRGPRCVFRSEWLRPDSVGATALVTGWWGSVCGVAVEQQGCCRIIWCRGEGKKIACGRMA